MEQLTSSAPVKGQHDNESRSEVLEHSIKREPRTSSPQHLIPDRPPSKSPGEPIPTTEAPDPSPMPPKKKGTATVKKHGPKKRPAPSSLKRMKKKPRSNSGSPAGSHDEEEGDTEEAGESGEGVEDEGPYCLCRGPDDHTWMIGCEICEDWFHGRCINMTKEVGNNLVEKFVCPNCTEGERRTIFKKVCAHRSCCKPARLKDDPPSVFCSGDHAQFWWEKMVGKMPKSKNKAGLNDNLMQDEFMALLGCGLASVDEEGKWKLLEAPFKGDLPKDLQNDEGDPLLNILSEEEKQFLDSSAKSLSQLEEETQLCQQMLNLIELAQQQRRIAITSGRFGSDSCGYDSCLDTVSAKDAFATFIRTSEGKVILESRKLSDPKDKRDQVRGMCDKKRCKVHREWHKILPLGVKHRIREIVGEKKEVEEEERIVREAAEERWQRRKAENNWVEKVE